MSAVSQFPPAHLLSDDKDGESSAPDGSAKDAAPDGPARPTMPLGLPAPGDAAAHDGTQGNADAQEDDDGAVKFDRLGPMVVNTDGTISRIHNWEAMTDNERERTKRLVVKRNQTRLAQLRAAEEAQAQSESTQSET